MAVLFALGVSSGLPYLLVGQTLQAWLTTLGVDLGAIAHVTLIGLAYNLKFAWAPLLDRYRLPLLGRRRGWMLATQLGLAGSLAVLGAVDPIARPGLLATVAVVVAFLSASQDVVLDAYANDVLAPEQRAAGSAVYILGYRVGMFVAGTLALVLAKRVPWRTVYATMAAVMAVGVIATLAADEPPVAERAPKTLATAFVQPIRELVHRFGGRRLARVLAFAALYELGYFVAQAMMTAFLLRGAHFDLDEIALVNKGMIFLGLAIGGAISGALVARHGAARMLVPFGAIAAATHLLYVALALAGHQLALLAACVLCDSIANALVSSAFVAVLMAACTPAVSATQMALFTALSSLLGLRVVGPLADHLVAAVGWPGFFVVTAALALPGLWIARRVGQEFAADAAPS
ncbi:MAG: AmpG family muropeptide MFS transporter [Acidobacteriota bacterium]